MDASLPPVVLLHGFGQTRSCWGDLASALAGHRAVISVDLPGHGAAGAVEADLWTTADLVVNGISSDDQPAAYIGYSMGGRIALHAALAHPRSVERLVLISATAGIDDEAEREQRHHADLALAQHIERVGIEQFTDEWLAQPLFAGLPPDARYVEERCSNSPAGLAASLRHAGTGSQAPLWDRLEELAMPVLILAGQDDAKFTKLAERMARTIGSNATLAIVGSSGHTVHLEQPTLTADLITAWLDH